MDLIEAALTDHVVYARHPWELARAEVIASLLKDAAPRLFTDAATVLDVGCGDTFLIETLGRRMPRTNFLAVDPAFTTELLETYATRHRDSAAPIRLFRTMEEVTAAQPGSIDCVLLLDVIEHISDDIGFLKGLLQCPAIGRNTVFLITVPAYQKLFSSHDVFLGHFRRYDTAMLDGHARSAGLVPLKTGYFFSSLLIPRIVTLLIEKAARRSFSGGVGGWHGHPLAGQVMKQVLVADFRMTRALSKIRMVLPGLSSYALCKVSAKSSPATTNSGACRSASSCRTWRPTRTCACASWTTAAPTTPWRCCRTCSGATRTASRWCTWR
jgi:hypothetical protein